MHELAAGGPSGPGKLRRQIVRRPPKRARTRLGVTLADEGLKMAADSEALVHHNKRLMD
jgi:cobalamin biosynthesis protein CobT